MEHVREIDVERFQKNGVTWVKVRPDKDGNGVSTSDLFPNNPKNWWKVLKGTSYPSGIKVINDHDEHWAWAPAKDMPLDSYVKLLNQMNASFSKLK